MNSLVGYGVSSESDSDGDVEDVNNAGDGSAQEAAAVTKTRNFLLEPGSASSESDSESDPEEEDPEPWSSPPPPPPSHPQTPPSSVACQPTLPSPFLNPNKLPPPSLIACSDSSVFANPFKAQADQKLSALQKHVPLTMQAKPTQIGGKRMCVSYRKDGRCRFGIKCKFAHDSDLQTPVAPTECHPPVGEEASDAAEAHHAGGSQSLQQESREDESGGQQGKKRRVGLSNTLIPPKRAMKQYAMQRDRERINMS